MLVICICKYLIQGFKEAGTIFLKQEQEYP